MSPTGFCGAQQSVRIQLRGSRIRTGCHQNMTDEDLWSKVNSSAFVDNEQHKDVMGQAVHAFAENRAALQAQ